MFDYFYFAYIFISTFSILNQFQFNFDKQIAANIFVRLIHSTGCSYHLIPILYKYDFTIIDINNTIMPKEVIYVFDRSISYFLWDCIALLISNEKEKLIFILHHMISLLSIGLTRYYGYNWYLICLGIFLGEVTNPLTQYSAFSGLIKYQNSSIEEVYFYSMLIVRGMVCPLLVMITYYNIYYYYNLIKTMVFMYQCSIFITYTTMILLTIFSIDWLNDKYKIVYKEKIH